MIYLKVGATGSTTEGKRPIGDVPEVMHSNGSCVVGSGTSVAALIQAAQLLGAMRSCFSSRLPKRKITDRRRLLLTWNGEYTTVNQPGLAVSRSAPSVGHALKGRNLKMWRAEGKLVYIIGDR
jgi:hypothetical protein